MTTEQLIETYFSNEQALNAYLFARLNNDFKNAPPPVSSYQSPERPEDVLFTIYHSNELGREQKEWFWRSLNTHAERSWQGKNADFFGHAVYLYIRLGLDEAEAFNWQNFLGSPSLRWQSGMPDNEIALLSSALWILNRWHLVAKPSFWDGQFSTITALIGEDERLLRPLNHVFSALGGLKAKHWERLFVACNNTPALREVLDQYVLIHFGESSGDAAKEGTLIENLIYAISAAKGNPKDISKPLCKMIKTWKTLAWTKSVKADVENLMVEITPKEKAKASPMQRNRSLYSENRQAA